MAEKKTTTKSTTEKTTVTEKDGHKVVIAKKTTKPAKDTTHQYSKGVQYAESGKRKDAIARVILRPGAGKITVNDKYDVTEYFSNRQTLLAVINKPLKTANLEGQYDIAVRATGGGKSGQAGAIAHGIAKAILLINPELKKQLKIEGLITRDSRVKETKKYGRKKARKGYTYRKR